MKVTRKAFNEAIHELRDALNVRRCGMFQQDLLGAVKAQRAELEDLESAPADPAQVDRDGLAIGLRQRVFNAAIEYARRRILPELAADLKVLTGYREKLDGIENKILTGTLIIPSKGMRYYRGADVTVAEPGCATPPSPSKPEPAHRFAYGPCVCIAGSPETTEHEGAATVRTRHAARVADFIIHMRHEFSGLTDSQGKQVFYNALAGAIRRIQDDQGSLPDEPEQLFVAMIQDLRKKVLDPALANARTAATAWKDILARLMAEREG